MTSPSGHPTKLLDVPGRGRDRRARKPHVISDRTSRILKAGKIISIVGLSRFLGCRRILEIGCGSGLISVTLASEGNSDLVIDAVDVVDSRVETEGYRFSLVHDTTLPFGDGVFDLVITNHVIEHVGDESTQLSHLAEVKRVTAENGLIYFAAPNKWRLVEPHYRLPLLSWLPRSASDRYLRFTRLAAYYDCFPRSRSHFIRLFETAGLAHADRTTAALRQTLVLEHPDHVATRLVNAACPDWLLGLGKPVVPTLVFLLRHASSCTNDDGVRPTAEHELH
ncbi:MAG TPA: class I SAM-dependent methyltransferase [Rhodanobacteraceae bacterium]|nr:class I SAM-dependent methyltransferase [Rhodanobacteraceae bacterium]